MKLDDRAVEGVPVSLTDELGEVAAFVLATQSVANLNCTGLGGALILGLGDIALRDLDGLAGLYVIKGDTHVVLTSLV
jgi:hypothetical protein